jgi:hypothetical protein
MSDGDGDGPRTRAVVLVEGVSDRVALEVLARRRGLDLAGDGVALVSMDGITNLGHFLLRYAAEAADSAASAVADSSEPADSAEPADPPPGILVAGLYDDAEERVVRRALRRIGLDPAAGADGLEALGFFGCSADLEDELIRALGPVAVERLVEAEGQLRSFRTLQKQPAQRGRSLHEQLRRLMGGRSGGKERYAAVLAGAVPLERAPRPLNAVLEYIYAKG